MGGGSWGSPAVAVNSFRDLRVWQGGVALVQAVYQATRSFPREEIFGLTSQIRRAAVSVPSNIAEGHARESTREYLQHVSVAQGSLAELQTQLEISGSLNYLTDDQLRQRLEMSTTLARQLYSLRNALQRKLDRDTR